MTDGFYHITESYTTEKGSFDDLIEEVLVHGYFKAPYTYRDIVKSEKIY